MVGAQESLPTGVAMFYGYSCDKDYQEKGCPFLRKEVAHGLDRYSIPVNSDPDL